MTLWALFLLAAFFVVGLSARFAVRHEVRTAVILAALVLVAMRALVW